MDNGLCVKTIFPNTWAHHAEPGNSHLPVAKRVVLGNYCISTGNFGLRKVVPRGVKLRIKSFREARHQALIARGDVSWGPRLAKAAAEGLRPEAMLPKEGLGVDALSGPIRFGSPLPWGYLMREKEQRELEGGWREVLDATREH